MLSQHSAGNENDTVLKVPYCYVLPNWLQQGVECLRFVAGDGYMMEVPKKWWLPDIILAYEIDTSPYRKTKPVRAIVPEERSMYWV